MFTKIEHVAVHCSDLDRSVSFYQDAFGFDLVNRMEHAAGRMAYLQLGDTALELTEKSGEQPSGYHICIGTDDMDGAIAHLAAQGAQVVRETHPSKAQGDTKRAVYAGPDGEMIELRG